MIERGAREKRRLRRRKSTRVEGILLAREKLVVAKHRSNFNFLVRNGVVQGAALAGLGVCGSSRSGRVLQQLATPQVHCIRGDKPLVNIMSVM